MLFPFLHTFVVMERVRFIEEGLYIFAENWMFRDLAKVFEAARLEDKMDLSEQIVKADGCESRADKSQECNGFWFVLEAGEDHVDYFRRKSVHGGGGVVSIGGDFERAAGSLWFVDNDALTACFQNNQQSKNTAKTARRVTRAYFCVF